MAKQKTKGVFKIVSQATGKEFYGASAQIEVVYRDYMKRLKEGKHSNKALQEEYDKYGADNFELIILKELPDADRKALYQAKKECEEGLV